MSKDTHSVDPVDPETPPAHHPEDDVIVVPKGSSRARFVMTAILALLVLTTFTVSGEVVDVLTGRNRAKSSYMRWKRPDGTVEDVKQVDFMLVKQELAKAESILSGGRSSKERDDARIARHILFDELAQESGVEVTNTELAELILQRFGSADVYQQMLDHFRTTPQEFERTLKALLRVDRYEQLLSEAAAIPDPATILDRWKKSHVEYSLETIEVPTDRFADEAKAACPSGDALKTWFEALPDAEKNTFRSQVEARTAAEFAWFAFEPQTSTEHLLAKYPRPSSEKPEEVAKTWYEANKDLLFRKPGLPPGKIPAPEDYLTFDEVKDRAQAEGLANQSISDWFNDMKVREEKGETIQLGAEVGALGLGYRKEIAAHTRAEWRAAGMVWTGQGPLAAMFAPTSQVGKFLPDVLIDAKGLFVGRLLEKQDSRVPAFEEFQDKVRDSWIAKKKGELALAQLEELRAKLPKAAEQLDPANESVVEPDAEKFQAAARELKLEAKTQDWFDAGSPIQGGLPGPFALFQRQAVQTLGDTIGAVSKPSLAADKSAAWIARLAATRPPEASRMTPQDFQTARQLAIFESRQTFYNATFGSDEYLKKHYGLELEAWRRDDTEKSPPPSN